MKKRAVDLYFAGTLYSSINPNWLVLSVIIVNYNVKHFLEQCLLSVQKALSVLEGEIIVVDNDSTDLSREYLEHKFTSIKFIWKKTNDGFARACNEGLSIASGDYILFLNPDTLVPEDCFVKCIAFLKQKSNGCALGVKMLDGSGRFLRESKRAFPSPLTSIYKLCGLAKLFPGSETFARYYLGHMPENEIQEVDVLAGAFIMIPAEVIYKIGSFDENYFMYGEDIDLSFRIQENGFKNFYFPEVRIIHFKGESTRKDSIRYVKLFYKAMSIFARKHYRGTRGSIFNIFLQAGIFLTGLVAGVKNVMQQVGMKVIDAFVILSSFWLVKIFWNVFIKTNVSYSANLLWIAFGAFTLLFWLTAYVAGLYDNGFRQSRLNKVTILAIVILLAAYSLLPESIRFSRGIILFGSLVAFVIMSLLRRWMISWRIIEEAQDTDDLFETAVVGNQANYFELISFYESRGIHKRIIGRISTVPDQQTTLGHIDNLQKTMQDYSIKELIFCIGAISYAEIIDGVSNSLKGTKVKFFNPITNTILQSENSEFAGQIVTETSAYTLAQPIERRKKRLLDSLVSLFFLVTFPVHLFIKKRPGMFFKDAFGVLTGRKTWVGYAIGKQELPALPPGVLSSTGLPPHLNSLSDQDLTRYDARYAKDYHYLKDLKSIYFNYRLLS